MKINYKITLLTYIILISFASCKHSQPVAEKNSASENETVVSFSDIQLKNAGIRLGRPERRTLSSVIKAQGVVDVPPQNLVSISFPMSGYLKSTQLLPGMKVSKGEKIAVLEDQAFIQLQQDYLVAKSKLEFLQKEYERQQQLNTSKTTSDKTFEQVKSEYSAQKVSVRALDERLRLIGLNPDRLTENNLSRSVNILSPINGYVSVVNVNIGKYISPTDILFELVNPSDLHLALTIFEKDLPYLQPGQKIKAYVTAQPEKIYHASILLLGKKLDDNRSSIVHCHFSDSEHGLLPGMFMNAEIEAINSSALSVPEQAVVRFGDKQYVFMEKGKNTFEMQEVKTGMIENGYTELKDAESLSGKTFITANAYSALMKLKNEAEE